MPNHSDHLPPHGLHLVPEDMLDPSPDLGSGSVLLSLAGISGMVPPGAMRYLAPVLLLHQPVLDLGRPVRRIHPDLGTCMVQVPHPTHTPGIMDRRRRHRQPTNPLVFPIHADGVLVAEVGPTGFLRPLRIPVRRRLGS